MDSRRIKIVSSIPPNKGTGPQWSDLTAYTWAVTRRYCEIHGYSFHGDVSDVWMPLTSPYVDQAPSAPQSPIRYIQKFNLMHHFLKPECCGIEYDIVAWVDADWFPVQMDVPITKWTNTLGRTDDNDDTAHHGDVIVPWDINSWHPTVLIARSSALTRDLFWALTEAGDRLYRQMAWSDHQALRHFMSAKPYDGLLHQHSAKVLCAQHPGLYPPKSKLYEFVEGESWALHLSALSIEMRIALAQQYIQKYGLLG